MSVYRGLNSNRWTWCGVIWIVSGGRFYLGNREVYDAWYNTPESSCGHRRFKSLTPQYDRQILGRQGPRERTYTRSPAKAFGGLSVIFTKSCVPDIIQCAEH